MKNNSHFKIVFAICTIALLINVGTYGVIETSDARYAEISREMFMSGNYLQPNLLDIHHYHKPPITYQITALGYKLFGVTPFGARFFLQIAILIQLLLVYALAQLLFNNKKTALWAVLIYFSFPLVLISSRNLTTDAFLTTFTLLSIYGWVKYRKSGFYKWLYLFALSLGLGFLTKGPVVFIVPIVFIPLYNGLEKPKSSFTIHHIFSWLLFLGIALSWFVYLAIQNHDFINYFLGRQTIDRFSKNVFGRTEPFWYFLVYDTLINILWFIILPYLLIKQKKLFKFKSIYTALLMVCFVPLIFFSLASSKRILYVLPTYGLLAILLAQLISKMPDNKNSRFIHYSIIGFSSLILIGFSLTPFLTTELIFPKSLILISIMAVLVILLIYKTKNIDFKSKSLYTAFAISVVLLIGSSSIFANNQLKVNSSQPITDFIIKKGLNKRPILVYNTRKPSIAFGLKKSITSLNDGKKSLARETQFETDLKWKNYLIDMKNNTELDSLKNRLKKPTVLLVYKKSLPQKLIWLSNNYKNKKVIQKWTIYY